MPLNYKLILIGTKYHRLRANEKLFEDFLSKECEIHTPITPDVAAL